MILFLFNNNKVCAAETLPSIKSNSVQLLTAFESAHWFDLQKFFLESNRILVKNGIIAFIGYFLPEIVDPLNPNDERVTELVLEAYNDPLLAAHKNSKAAILEKRYRDLKFPLNYEFVHKDNILNTIKANAQQLIGYVESWSLYQGLVAKDERLAQNYIQQIQIKLKDILKTSDLSKREIIINFNYFIAMARKLE
jgi:phenylalanyl-tRNA synthetase beta subunit